MFPYKSSEDFATHLDVMPINTVDKLEKAADTVVVINRAGLDMSAHHKVEKCEVGLSEIAHRKLVPAGHILLSLLVVVIAVIILREALISILGC